jgi:hypothetical protein
MEIRAESVVAVWRKITGLIQLLTRLECSLYVMCLNVCEILSFISAPYYFTCFRYTYFYRGIWHECSEYGSPAVVEKAGI